MDKLDMESKNIVSSNIEKIKELFPNVITEDNGKEIINFDALKQELSDVIIDEKKEKYQLTWPGKKQAIVNANSPISKTLRPLKDKSVNFDSTKNIYIEGDNLDVLKILQESYLSKIKCIYIDPPYNTGNDFIYNDNFNKGLKNELLDSGQCDELGNRLISNNNSNGRFHSDWLSMMYSRLKLARNLMTDDGIIFISIDDNEISNLKKICDEIFGENAFAGIVHRRKNRKPHNAGNSISLSYEFVLIYYKSKVVKLVQEYGEMQTDSKGSFAVYPMIKADKKVRTYTLPAGTYCECKKIESRIYKAGRNSDLDIEYLDSTDVKNNRTLNDIRISARFCLTDENGRFSKAVEEDNIFININGFPKEKRYRTDEDFKIDNHHWDIEKGKNEDGDDEIKDLFGITGINNLFSYPKPTALIEKVLSTIPEKDYIVLDFFSGSATTAHAVMNSNAKDGGKRKYILIQLDEKIENPYVITEEKLDNICLLGEKRIKLASDKIKNDTNANIDYGFRVYKVDDSNMKDVFYKPNEVSQQSLFDYISNIKEDRTAEDLLTQVILNLGLTLDLPIEEKELGNNKVYYVADNALVACFDDVIDINIIDTICECQPLKVVFKDSSFKTDKDKINLEERVKKISPETKISIL